MDATPLLNNSTPRANTATNSDPAAPRATLTCLPVPASLDVLGAEIVGMAGRLAAATCRWLLLVADFDAREGAAHFGLWSTAKWLSHSCGLSRRTSVDHVRVARALAMFPPLATEMSAGRLSYSHVRAISRVASPGEDALVAELITVAEHGTVGHLEAAVRGLRTVDRIDAGRRREASLTYRWTDESQWQLSSRMNPEDGALVQSAIERISAAEGISAPQALLRMAELATIAMNDSTPPVRELRGHERAAVVIHLDVAAVPAVEADTPTTSSAEAPASTDGRAYGRIEGGPGLSKQVVTRLLCDGRIRTAIRDGAGNVLDLGRSHRVVSDRQFQALLLRDGCCTFPGCESRRNLQAHHVRHWLDGGCTDLGNLTLLCQAHHLAHHEGEFVIVPIDGVDGYFEFLRADGTSLRAGTTVPPVSPASPIDDEHPNVALDAARTRWDGQRMDHHWAIAVLAERRAWNRRN
ncbi:uncharacterized protein DUF222 [Jatrophihabitans sp. GAS493]|uniref:HNH endonuclease signature motif containing protein n=1 Tax=Jatrophihabitans sp. GAS493 TaxID=1907575 RepID=UPI000BB860D1|nr:HNH endonuclease signature motif containing protein [Jatrophihabitans sp. GAS493]SOD70844.1 uncharacterized protein DUF222 [Jatrophihabitans sp. GAS493]